MIRDVVGSKLYIKTAKSELPTIRKKEKLRIEN